MTHVAILLAVIVAIPGSLLLRAWMWRVRGAKLVVENGAITTELGRFCYRPAEKTLDVSPRSGRPCQFVLSGPVRFVCSPEVSSALLKEVLSSLYGGTDFGITDLLPRYRDYQRTFVLALESAGQRVPLAVLTQYCAKDMWDSLGGNDSVRAILSGLGLYRDIDAVAEARAFELKDALARQGLALD